MKILNTLTRHGRKYLECLCPCGLTCEIRADQVSRRANCGRRCPNFTTKSSKSSPLAIVGERFGHLVVSKYIPGGRRSKFELLCDCGNIITWERGRFDKPGKHSCGCQRNNNFGKPKRLDLTGAKFGTLTATTIAGLASCGKTAWECRCDCGQVAIKTVSELRRGARRGFLDCGDRTAHPRLKYPPMPDLWPPQMTEFVLKFRHLIKRPVEDAHYDIAHIEDRRADRLYRAVWILICRMDAGEVLSEKHQQRFIKKHLRFANFDRSRSTINPRKIYGIDVTNSTHPSYPEKAPSGKDSGENHMRRRIKFKRV